VPVGLRIGTGFDVHAFGPAADHAAVVLGGVTIPCDAPLVGHSDADVAAHAVADALLGAAALGDLGTRFGVANPALAGAGSLRLLATVVADLAAAGWRPGNVDVTVIALRPRIGPHRIAMRERLAGVLDLDPAAVSVKATTTDGLGAVGRGEGVAAQAVCLIVATGGPEGPRE
jgi:2-C-methyl-D-erythritol 2,4-cyclodiphosphate synthase